METYTDIEQSKKLIECNDFLSNRKSVKSKETVYTCDICPHQGNLMCCHNCPNF